MRIITIIAIAIAIIMSAIPSYSEIVKTKANVVINGKSVDFRRSPSLKEGNLMVPAAKLVEELKGKISWDERKRVFTITKADKYLKMKIGSIRVAVRGGIKAANTSPYLDNGMVMVSLRYICDELGERVYWDSKNSTAYVGSYMTLGNRGKPLSSYRVLIDPGHGGSETGAIHGGVYEKDINLQISKYLRRMLEDEGIKTYMTRDTDKEVGLYERTEMADRVNADLLISIHNNAGYKSMTGSMTLYYPYGKVTTGGLDQLELAQIVQGHLVNGLGMKNLGIIKRPYLAVLRTSNVPAVLAEIGYMSNPYELTKLKNSDFQKKSANALKNAIIEALGKI